MKIEFVKMEGFGLVLLEEMFFEFVVGFKVVCFLDLESVEGVVFLVFGGGRVQNLFFVGRKMLFFIMVLEVGEVILLDSGG